MASNSIIEVRIDAPRTSSRLRSPPSRWMYRGRWGITAASPSPSESASSAAAGAVHRRGAGIQGADQHRAAPAGAGRRRAARRGGQTLGSDAEGVIHLKDQRRTPTKVIKLSPRLGQGRSRRRTRTNRRMVGRSRPNRTVRDSRQRRRSVSGHRIPQSATSSPACASRVVTVRLTARDAFVSQGQREAAAAAQDRLVLIEAVVPQMDIPPLLTELAQSASAANAGTPSRIRSSR